MKAITPVIALVMLLLITVGIVGVSYAWIGGIITSSTTKAISIPPGGAYCDSGDIKVYIVNNGEDVITSDDIIVADVDGVSVLNTPFFGDMNSDLVGYWKFDDMTDPTQDSSGNGNSGDLVNGPEWVIGKSRNALKFDGTNNYVVTPSSNVFAFGTGPFTMSGWFYMEELPVNYDAFKSSATSGGLAALIANNRFSFGKSLISEDVQAAYIPPINQWFHLTMTRKDATGNTGHIYFNGMELATTGTSTANYPAGNTIIGIDGNYASFPFNGIIDELKVYASSIGDVNIQPAQSGLVVSYPGIEGKHTVRLATSSGLVETTVTCN